MFKGKYVLQALLLSLTLSAAGQEAEKVNEEEIGVSVFRIDYNGITLNGGLKPKFTPGIYYIRSFSNLSWISQFDYGNNTITDECKSCKDSFYGKGKMVEFEVSTGIRNVFLSQNNFFLKPFAGADLYFSNTHYSGSFSGGFAGQGITIDMTDRLFGLRANAGLIIYPLNRLSIIFSSSAGIALGIREDFHRNLAENVNGFSLTAIKISMGYIIKPGSAKNVSSYSLQ